ncbi:MAG: adenine-specific methyltransferase EcoRI family protein [Candidatus Gracilibacteria bacterium]|nr:adenine-specific methyltransferase EcoRI family protein [Candidatus Gracilibacteria bacterium]
MEKKSGNNNLKKANKAKKDEFYTQLSDIERELGHYKEYFTDKVIFCNCDDPEESNFFKYFALNFEYLGLKKLIATHFETEKSSYKLEITRGLDLNNDGKIDLQDTKKIKLKQNGDFRSPECIEILESCDIVVTNPPFSLFRDYVAQLFEYDKKFITIGHQNAITYKEIFKLIKENKIWLGYGFKGGAGHFINTHYEDCSSCLVTIIKEWKTMIKASRS